MTGTDRIRVIRLDRVRAPPETAEMIREIPYQTMMFTLMGMMALKECAMPSGTTSGSLMVQLWSMTNLLMATEHRPTMMATNMPPVPRLLRFRASNALPMVPSAATTEAETGGETTRM